MGGVKETSEERGERRGFRAEEVLEERIGGGSCRGDGMEVSMGGEEGGGERKCSPNTIGVERHWREKYRSGRRKGFRRSSK
ncbi:hypothetical protein SOVF_215450, partial [Spinacia oleracea]